jgi:hypothetical protein
MDGRHERIAGPAVKMLAYGVVHSVVPPRDHASVLAKLSKDDILSGVLMGFVTDTERFVDRAEAYIIALRAGQVKARAEKILTSEDLGG